MPLADGQWQLRSLVMGPGTAYELVSVDGLGNAPVRPNDIERRVGGVVPARDALDKRTLTFAIEVVGTPGSDLGGKLAALFAAWACDDTTVDLTFKRAGFANARVLHGRPRRADFTYDQPADMGYARIAAQFDATDPNLYDAVASTVVYW